MTEEIGGTFLEAQDWEMPKTVLEFFKVFYLATTTFSNIYISISHYIEESSNIENENDRRLNLTMNFSQTIRLSQKNLRRGSGCLPPIVYSDKGIVVINKPSGLVCQSDKSVNEVNLFLSL